ncbi:MAG: hypothetical protein RKE49_14785 [Oceanicaulis sp.]
MARIHAAIVVACAAAIAPAQAPAHAQWPRPVEDSLTIATVSFHWLDSASGRPDLIKEEIAVYTEQAIDDGVTLIARSAAQSVREDVPIQRRRVVVDGKETEVVIAPEREFGVGGIELGARVRLREAGPWIISAQGVFGVPGSGENRINERFGEGGGDTDLRLQAGRALKDGAFVAASGGWRNRRGEDRDEIRLDLTAGRPLERGVHIFVQSYSVWSTRGGPRAASDYSGHRLQASILLPVTRRSRLQIGALATVRSDNMARERAVTISLWRRF